MLRRCSPGHLEQPLTKLKQHALTTWLQDTQNQNQKEEETESSRLGTNTYNKYERSMVTYLETVDLEARAFTPEATSMIRYHARCALWSRAARTYPAPRVISNNYEKLLAGDPFSVLD